MTDIKIPSPGESISEVVLSRWLIEDGAFVEKDQAIAEIDSDKATLELSAENSGQIKILIKEGETVKVGSVVAKIDTGIVSPSSKNGKSETKEKISKEKKAEKTESVIVENEAIKTERESDSTPLAREIMKQNKVEAAKLRGSGTSGRITKSDVEAFMSTSSLESSGDGWGGARKEERKKMSPLRKKLSQRLVAVKNQTAMLTTFNEVDMSQVINLRKKYKEQFKALHGISLGFMSFFTKAVTQSLHLFPQINSAIYGDEIVFYDYADIGIAVSAPKGLMVPVLRNAEKMSFAEIEKNIFDLANKARESKISIEEMTGGTFTITNGGVFGSMLSTPILNPPQSAILGMHNIVERPVAVNGKVEIRPVMYVALSYDHRVIDGKDSVGFLVKVKEMIENPLKMLMDGKIPEEVLLGL